MRLIPSRTNIDFMGVRPVTVAMSCIAIIISLGSLGLNGLNLAVDFTGGIVVQVQYEQAVSLDNVRSDMHQAGYPDATVQLFGSPKDVMIRLRPQPGEKTGEVRRSVLGALQASHPNVNLKKVQFVGPQVGQALFHQGSLALLFAFIGILAYVIIRFEWRFAVGSVAALVHDVIITLGFFSLTGLKFDLTALAAILTIIGYSVNDTIVVFDRIREDFRLLRKRNTIEITNAAINETLSRTIITSGVTMLAVLSLVFLGGESIRSFSLALVVGIIVGTYSSVYIASALTLLLGLRRDAFMPAEKKSGEDSMP